MTTDDDDDGGNPAQQNTQFNEICDCHTMNPLLFDSAAALYGDCRIASDFIMYYGWNDNRIWFLFLALFLFALLQRRTRKWDGSSIPTFNISLRSFHSHSDKVELESHKAELNTQQQKNVSISTNDTSIIIIPNCSRRRARFLTLIPI